ncbi:MAG: 4-(cytidine 5'-diphospho)-2-C-methyl-D-erythritol kinase [Muribaculaceae bacterium]|nr:4-(cytidine 5'-diphospho)-2-C-methyl-D-erythritol kinase [Muribaculaceae bacterium]
MILFPNAKINIGLRIVNRRPDGYHDIESVMLPVPWCDVLELVRSASGYESFTLSGSTLGGCPPEKNLVIKALRALEAYTGKALPPFDIYLHKVIPDGAGLGGGSSDASAALIAANELAGLGMSKDELAAVATRVGADCPFFIYNRPMVARGIGERLSPVDIPALSGLGLAIVKPGAEAVSTREAYAGVHPHPMEAGSSIESAVAEPVELWQSGGVLINDFEPSVFALRPQIGATLARLRAKGAVYSAMSGSGASVFGIFPTATMAEEAVSEFKDCSCFSCRL